MNIPATIECHCMSDAHRYFQKTFVNQLNQTVIRVWYKCVNCKSRTPKDYIEALEGCDVDVFELIKKYNANK